MQKSTNTNLIYPKSTNEYKDAYTKDLAKWQKVYQPQTKSYAYEPVMPNHIPGKITVPADTLEVQPSK